MPLAFLPWAAITWRLHPFTHQVVPSHCSGEARRERGFSLQPQLLLTAVRRNTLLHISMAQEALFLLLTAQKPVKRTPYFFVPHTTYVKGTAQESTYFLQEVSAQATLIPASSCNQCNSYVHVFTPPKDKHLQPFQGAQVPKHYQGTWALSPEQSSGSIPSQDMDMHTLSTPEKTDQIVLKNDSD